METIMERWDIYDIKRAVLLYLDSEEKVDFNKDCIITNGVIVEWTIKSKEKPTIIQLEDAWHAGKLEHYKKLHKLIINEEFNYLQKKGRAGCVTTVIGSDDKPIVVDARRGGDYDDYSNFRMSIDLIKYTGMKKIIVKDFYNNQHEISSEKMEIIYKELLIHGISFLQEKWAKINEIEQCTTIEDIVKITLLV